MADPVISQIQPFLNALQFEKRYSPYTIRAYHDDLTQFFDYLQIQYGSVHIQAIAPFQIRSWLASLKDQNLTAKSINRKLSTLKSFFKYQLRSGVLEASPLATVSAPKISKKLPGYIERDNSSNLNPEADFSSPWEEKTCMLLIAIFYNTGMRLSELVNLKESYIDGSNQTIKVLGKGNKERIIPVSAGLISKLSTYQAEKRTNFAQCNLEFLFVNGKGRKLYHKYVYRCVHKYLSTLTTLQKRSPHVLRHTFATHLANNGADLTSIKELLGHASLASTQVYLHTTIDKLKDIHKKAHPKS